MTQRSVESLGFCSNGSRGLLIDALSPLSPSAAASPSGHPSPPPVDSEPYAVFRNKISLSAVQPHSPTAAAPDYFSLDLGKDETTVDLAPVRSAAAIPIKEPERRLENFMSQIYLHF
ncbi:hypothetical protein RHMOL_Rhmol09G0122300 [Rhododendron molle]|uniref:Uncharacterized protein n=1 Tax=Rhododendron molle TaxID=49168 RepID=A0ACC0MCP0_RHOML|nr:hypothetical protein RHMOL_Rhmol09G0122300 [Rhododendron molle]